MIQSFTRKVRTAVAVVCVIGLSACQSTWDAEPDFGSSVNGAIKSQVRNPNAPVKVPKTAAGLDGPAAKNAVDSYQKSFERKQPVTSGASQSGTMVGTSVGITVQ